MVESQAVITNARFPTDEQGRKQAVVLPIDEFRSLVERLEDLEDRKLLALVDAAD